MHDACLFPTTIFPQKPWEVRSMGFSRWCRRTFKERRTNYRTTVRGSRSIQNRRQRKRTQRHTTGELNSENGDAMIPDTTDSIRPLSFSLGQARESSGDVVLACLWVGSVVDRSFETYLRDTCATSARFYSIPCHFRYWNGF